MVTAWIVITLMFAAIVGGLGAGISSRGDHQFGFFMGFVFTIQISILVAVIYVSAHFIEKFW